MERIVILEPGGLRGGDRIADAILRLEAELFRCSPLLVHLDRTHRFDRLPLLSEVSEPDRVACGLDGWVSTFAEGKPPPALRPVALQGGVGRVLIAGPDFDRAWRALDAAAIASGHSIRAWDSLMAALDAAAEGAPVVILPTPGLSPELPAFLARAALVVFPTSFASNMELRLGGRLASERLKELAPLIPGARVCFVQGRANPGPRVGTPHQGDAAPYAPVAELWGTTTPPDPTVAELLPLLRPTWRLLRGVPSPP